MILEKLEMKLDGTELEEYFSLLPITSAAPEEGDDDQLPAERTLVVKRFDLTFQGKDCQLLTFADATAAQTQATLKKENKKLKMMNLAISHELLVPLSATA